MTASWPHSVAAPTSSASMSLKWNQNQLLLPNVADLAWFLGFGLDWLQSCIGEVAFGVGAAFMAASQPHGVMAPTSSASKSFQMESKSAPSPILCGSCLIYWVQIWNFGVSASKPQVPATPPVAIPPHDVSIWDFPPCHILIFNASYCKSPLNHLILRLLQFPLPWEASHSNAPTYHLVKQCLLLQCPPCNVSFWDFSNAPSPPHVLSPCLLLRSPPRDISFWDFSDAPSLPCLVLWCLLLHPPHDVLFKPASSCN